jgi:hypothetical protein
MICSSVNQDFVTPDLFLKIGLYSPSCGSEASGQVHVADKRHGSVSSHPVAIASGREDVTNFTPLHCLYLTQG